MLTIGVTPQRDIQMIHVQRRSMMRLMSAGLLAAALGTGIGRPTSAAFAAAPLVTRDAGIWDLSFEQGNRRCRLNLRNDPVPPGFAVAMPAGCHRAFPLLGTVTNWSPGAGDHVVFQDAGGQPVLDFGPGGGASLSAMVGEGAVYMLVPTDEALQDALRNEAAAAAAAAVPAEPTPPAAPSSEGGVLVGSHAASAAGVTEAAAAALRPVTPGEVAGNYAVLRQSRDTGCMVTLEAVAARGDRASLKARLAPACRDQGIVIFDPVGWTLAKGQLMLTAKRGHTTALIHQPDQTWASEPVKGPPLVLKRL